MAVLRVRQAMRFNCRTSIRWLLRPAAVRWVAHCSTRVFVLQPRRQKDPGSLRLATDALMEAESLAEAVSGWRVCGSQVISLRSTTNAALGRGQIQAIDETLRGASTEMEPEPDEATVDGSKRAPALAIFFNVRELPAAQQRRLESAWGVQVFDRFRVIVSIFRSRASTRIAHMQLDLAQLAYERSRLVDPSAGHSQQVGATGKLSGAGEKQIELSRRAIDAHASKLRKEIALEGERSSRLDARSRSRALDACWHRPVVALVGYTNAGKSLLHSRLVGSNTDRAQDALFASLETQSRMGRLTDGSEVCAAGRACACPCLSGRVVAWPTGCRAMLPGRLCGHGWVCARAATRPRREFSLDALCGANMRCAVARHRRRESACIAAAGHGASRSRRRGEPPCLST